MRLLLTLERQPGRLAAWKGFDALPAHVLQYVQRYPQGAKVDTHDMKHSSQLVAAMEQVWKAMQADHADLPDVVLCVSSAGMRRGQLAHGHHYANRWQHGKRQLTEIWMAGESLKRGAVPTFGTLMHEAAHALCKAKGIKDTSRGGRYHNKRFKAMAEGMGLIIENHPTIGWSLTTVPDETAQRYRKVIAKLEQAIVIHRRDEAVAGRKERTAAEGAGRNYIKAQCSCEHTIRCARSLLEATEITCGDCGDPFMEA